MSTPTDEAPKYDAVLIQSFGGPSHPDDLDEFLSNVTDGKPIPQERLEQVKQQYMVFGGLSPIGQQTETLANQISKLLADTGDHLPVFIGNRNWHPYLNNTVEEMTRAGLKRALVFTTSGFSSPAGCRRYRDELVSAQAATNNKIKLVKLPLYHDHPLFIAGWSEIVKAVPENRRLVFTAHSIPAESARICDYEADLHAAAATIASDAEFNGDYDLVYQSRSGSPRTPWLEPDICDHLARLKTEGINEVTVAALGMASSHMEVLFDLDTQAAAKAAQLGLKFERLPTIGDTKALARVAVAQIQEQLATPDSTPTQCDPTCCERTELAIRTHR